LYWEGLDYSYFFEIFLGDYNTESVEKLGIRRMVTVSSGFSPFHHLPYTDVYSMARCLEIEGSSC
jgi:hypothetical protein